MKHSFLIFVTFKCLIISVNSSVIEKNEIIAKNVVVSDQDGKSEVGEVEDNSIIDFDHYQPKAPKKFTWNLNENPDYSKGYFGGFYFRGDDNSHFFSHGEYQRPSSNYYNSYKHKLEDKSALGYYLGYAMERMDHNEYFENHHFKQYNVHHYFFENNTMLSEQSVRSDELMFCAKNTSTFCPESTEAVCLLNTTVWCATQISFVAPCEQDKLKNDTNSNDCVTTRIPCVKADDSNCHSYIETVQLPCILRVTILDVNEDKNGLTFNNVAGTFVLGPVPPINETTFCVSIVAEPSL